MEKTKRRVDLTVEGEPLAKVRARVTKNGAYTPKRHRVNAEMLAWEIRIACASRPFEGPIAVGMIFYRSNRQRIDVDNMVKQVLDAATGVAWRDDSQVMTIVAHKRFDRERPRTIISIRDDDASNFETPVERLREATCERCGATFRYMPFPSQRPQRYCSRTCKATATCANEDCGAVFTKSDRSQRYCSRECAYRCKMQRRRLADRQRARARPKAHCRDCGAELARRTAVLCRPCWLASPNKRRKANVLEAA